jgi:hypothetical protein
MRRSLILLALFASSATLRAAQSDWVHLGPDGKLVYKSTDTGDRIMDFSYAGYMGGGVALPDVPVKRTVQPPSGDPNKDDTPTIQAAIDDVAKLQPDKNGFRGAVLLAPGTFSCSGTITITANGVVLRGSGEQSSTIKLTGRPHLAIAVRGGNGRERGRGVTNPSPDENNGSSPQEKSLASTSITDSYVPSGTVSFHVKSASGFAVGDEISIRKPVTDAWVSFMHMDDLTRDGKHETWIKTGTVIPAERCIAAIAGNTITVDVPLSDSYDAKFFSPTGVTVATIAAPPRSLVSQCGVENLHIESPPQEINHTQAHFTALHISGQDCWARDLMIDETMNSVGVNGRRITLQRVTVNRKARHLGASKPAEFAPNGTQVLLDRCAVNADNVWFSATGAEVSGPIVLLNCTFHGNGRAESHQRWSTGMLYDNCRAPDGGIEVRNRGEMGSGHGWSMGWGVLWNCTAKEFLVQNPPGAINWMIGCVGESAKSARPFGSGPSLPGGTEDSHDVPVTPRSLYLTQLAQRLGPQAVRNLGYASPDDLNGNHEHVAVVTPRESTQSLGQTDKLLGPNLALHRPVNTSNVRGDQREFAGDNAIDGDDHTYWATDDNVTRATIELDMEGGVPINAARITEALGPRVTWYKIEAQVDSDWKLLAHGTTIKAGEIARFPTVTAWKVRLTILSSPKSGGGGGGHPAIAEFGLYHDTLSAPDAFKPPPPLIEPPEAKPTTRDETPKDE